MPWRTQVLFFTWWFCNQQYFQTRMIQISISRYQNVTLFGGGYTHVRFIISAIMECGWLRLLVRCAGHAWASSSSLHSQMIDLFRIDTITKTKKHCLSILLICHYIQYSIYLVKRSNLECLNLVSRFLSTTREIKILRHFSRHEFTPTQLTVVGPERVGSNKTINLKNFRFWNGHHLWMEGVRHYIQMTW